MHIITLDASNKVLNQDPIHPHIGRTFRTSKNRTSYGCEINGIIAVVSCVAFTKSIAKTMNGIATVSPSPDTAMFWTVYKTKNAQTIPKLPQRVGAKALLLMVAHIRRHMPHITRFATLSPIPTLARKFNHEPEDIAAINDYLSMRKDPVARFHLLNGAKLHDVCRSADGSNLRTKQSYGIMANYVYSL